MGFGFWNGIETAGSLILGFSFLVFIFNIVKSLAERRGGPGGPVARRHPRMVHPLAAAGVELRGGADGGRPRPALGAPPRHGRHLPEPARVSGQGIHLPSPSYWPIVTAFGTALTLIGFLMHVTLWVILTGVAITMLGIFSWAFEPADH